MAENDAPLSLSSLKVCAIIPAFNEEASIAETLRDLRVHQPDVTPIVVNDASTDRTEVVARLSGVTVLSLAVNLGIGGAVQTGLRFARAQGFDVAIQFDGDGQHPAEEITALVAPILTGEVDAICGSRFLGSQEVEIGRYRRLGIRLLRRVISLLTRHPFTDPTSGFRAYNRVAIDFLADNYPQDYPEPESLVELHRNGFRTREIPVRMRARVGGRSSIGRLDSAYYMAKVLLAVMIAATRRKTAFERKEEL